MTTLVVIAKECLPGKVKTRLHPPLTLVQAAEVAAASLHDTLRTVASLPASRRILLFDGIRPPVGSEDYDVIPQTTGTLDERIAALFDQVAGPTVLIGMDTPQLERDDLAPVFDGEWPSDVDAWYGAATDGGFWALGLRDPDGALVRGVPMSQDDTGEHQLARLSDAGLRVSRLRTLTDVDHIDDAFAAAAAAPDGTFAAALRSALGTTR